MEGWVEFTDAQSGRLVRVHHTQIHHVEEREDGRTGIMYTWEIGQMVAEMYREACTRIDVAIQAEREALKQNA